MLLSICITSYNRPNELLRCLNSIDVTASDKVEIVVSEDVSPKREEIRKVLDSFSKTSRYQVVSNFNDKNLGYDRNLGKLISLASGDYIVFCSDDDAFVPNQIDKLIEILDSKQYGMVLSSYKSKDTFAFNRQYHNDFIIKSGEKSAIRHLYDGILFSGLVFKKELIESLDVDKFINTNYFQIYMLLKVIYNYGGAYKKISLIDCISDGENGYGTTELSEFDPLLSDRTSLYSNMKFNEGLIKVIKIFDEEEGTRIINSFEAEYSRKTYRGLSRARSKGRHELQKYWKELNKLDINIKFPAQFYYIMLYVMNSKVCDRIFKIPKNILFYLRKNGR